MKKLDLLALKAARHLIAGNYGYFSFIFSIISAVFWFLLYLYDRSATWGFISLLSLSGAIASFHIRGFELLLKQNRKDFGE
jgi:hypothetical protein